MNSRQVLLRRQEPETDVEAMVGAPAHVADELDLGAVRVPEELTPPMGDDRFECPRVEKKCPLQRAYAHRLALSSYGPFRRTFHKDPS